MNSLLGQTPVEHQLMPFDRTGRTRRSERRSASAFVPFVLLIYFVLACWMTAAIVGPGLKVDSGPRWWADSQLIMLYEEVYYYLPQFKLAGSTFGPLLVARSLGYNAVLICLANCGMLAAIFWLFRKFTSHSEKLFVLLMVMNPMLFFSLTSINKEILGALGIAFLLCYLQNRRPVFLAAALGVSFLSRWPQAIFVLGVVVMYGRAKRTWKTRYLLFAGGFLILSGAYPILLAQESLDEFNAGSEQFTEPQYEKFGGILKTINDMEERFEYPLVVVPKIALDLFSSLPRTWSTLTGSSAEGDDYYNTYIILFDQWACLAVLAVLVARRRLNPNSPATFISLTYCVAFAIVPLLNSRMFFPIYPLLCLQAVWSGYGPLDSRTKPNLRKTRGDWTAEKAAALG